MAGNFPSEVRNMVRDFHPTYWLGTIPRGGLSAQRLEAISFWCGIILSHAHDPALNSLCGKLSAYL